MTGAPDLNPDERVRRHAKRTGAVRNPLRAGEKLSIPVGQQRRDMVKNCRLARSVFQAPPCRLYFGLLRKLTTEAGRGVAAASMASPSRAGPKS